MWQCIFNSHCQLLHLIWFTDKIWTLLCIWGLACPLWSSSVSPVFFLSQNGETAHMLFSPLDSSPPTPLSSFHPDTITTPLCPDYTLKFQFKCNFFAQHLLTSQDPPPIILHSSSFLSQNTLSQSIIMYLLAGLFV